MKSRESAAGGEPNFTLTQVALNDGIMIFAFAPIVGVLLGLAAITVPWDTLFLSVVKIVNRSKGWYERGIAVKTSDASDS